MPQIIKPTGVSLDSLQSKILVLENTLKESNIKATFFSDLLTFQLFVFSTVLVLLGFFSWGFILRPMQIKLKTLTDKTIPKLVSDVKEEKDKEIKEVKSQYDDLRKLVYKGYISTLRQNAASAAILKDIELSFQAIVTFLAMDLKFHNSEIDQAAFLVQLQYSLDLITSKEFSYKKLSIKPENLRDLEEYLVFLTQSNDIKISLISFKILDKYLELGKMASG